VPQGCESDDKSQAAFERKILQLTTGAASRRSGDVDAVPSFGHVLARLWMGGGTDLTVSISRHPPLALTSPFRTDAEGSARFPIWRAQVPEFRRGRPSMFKVSAWPAGGGRQWAVNRRYRAFWLLNTKAVGMGFRSRAAFPPKRMMHIRGGNEPTEFLERRRRMLQAWLQEIVTYCGLPSVEPELCAHVLSFVGGDGGCALAAKDNTIRICTVRKPDTSAKVGINYCSQAIVTRILPGGPAAVAGIREGMRLLSVSGTAISSDAMAQMVLAGTPREFVVVVAEPQPQRSKPGEDTSYPGIGSGTPNKHHGSRLSCSSLRSRGGSSRGSGRRVSFLEPEGARREEPAKSIVTGALVQLNRLTTLSELNGLNAIVLEPASGRDGWKWRVRLVDSGEEVLVNERNLVLVEAPPSPAVACRRQQTPLPRVVGEYIDRLLTVRRVDGRSIGVSYDSEGVVTVVRLGGAAERAGLAEGMIMTSIGGQPVSSAAEVQQAFLAAGDLFSMVVREPVFRSALAAGTLSPVTMPSSAVQSHETSPVTIPSDARQPILSPAGHQIISPSATPQSPISSPS